MKHAVVNQLVSVMAKMIKKTLRHAVLLRDRKKRCATEQKQKAKSKLNYHRKVVHDHDFCIKPKALHRMSDRIKR